MGDDVQAIKAGVVEATDVFVVNKADRDGADRAVHDLEVMLALGNEVVSVGHRLSTAAPASENGWVPPIVRSVATRGQGMDELVDALERHRAHLLSEGRASARKEARLKHFLLNIVRDELLRALDGELRAAVTDEVDRIVKGETDPYTAGEALVRMMRRG
jgi:LAO/AO transport system kinase